MDQLYPLPSGVGERTREGNDLLREMLESGIIKYGEEFDKSMEEGGWDLSKVDKKAMKDSKATFVFGQMNEPPGQFYIYLQDYINTKQPIKN